jgi:ATP-dependent Lhr-like helicase
MVERVVAAISRSVSAKTPRRRSPRQSLEGNTLRRRAAPQGGKLKVMVATASLELGIDIGDVELVCQLGTPRSISVFLQRVGRANPLRSGGCAKGLATSEQSATELIAYVALPSTPCRAASSTAPHPEHPLNVLSPAGSSREVAAREYGEDELFDLFRTAYPYRRTEPQGFDAVVRTLRRGIATKRGRPRHLSTSRPAEQALRARKGARLDRQITCCGAIPGQLPTTR